MQPIASVDGARRDAGDRGIFLEKAVARSRPAAGAEGCLGARRRAPTGSVGCTGCHLDHFQGDGTVPRLAGQSRDYLTKTIADFRTRARGNNPGMSDLMLATSPDDLAALEEYLSGL